MSSATLRENGASQVISSAALREDGASHYYMLSNASPCPKHDMYLYSRYLSLKLCFYLEAKYHIDSAFCDFPQIHPICQNNS